VYKKLEEIRRVNKTSKVRLLSGTEVDISSEGKLDYSESLLKEFDVVVAAIHSGFKQSKQQLTKRIVSACKNKQVNIIAHPSGRLWGAREGYELNWDEVFRVARDYQVAIEINCYPQRLDLNDIHCMEAKKLGTKMALGTDSHILEQLKVMDLGVSVARRGWLEKKDIINCMNLEELLKWLKK
jgi:DNA polymerase (family 10)